jgi:UDP-N-acetylglucosamine--N-acetylmuramyl-(pentapeptide) pyrophosphoryl-undecaprenol N-acetylglucosamine transferase
MKRKRIRGDKLMKIVVTGGGTGGHIYTALAFINHLKRVNRQGEVLYIGTQNGMECQPVSKQGISFRSIDAQRLCRRMSLEIFQAFYQFFNSFKEAKKI